MTKVLKIFLITILSIIAVSITSVMVLVVVGKIDFKGLSISLNTKVSEKISYQHTFDKEFRAVNIVVDMANIEIKESDDNNFSLVVYDDYDKLELTDTADTLKINLPTKKCHWFCFNQVKGKVVLSIPSTYANSIKIDSGYGDIKIGNLKESKLDIVADYGDIEIGSAYDIKINEDYGDIKIGSVYNYINIENDYGDVDIDSLVIAKNSKIIDDYGDIEINSINNINVDADTDYGKVKVNSNNTNSKVTLKVRTDYGDVKVGTNKVKKAKEDSNVSYVAIINGQEYNIVFESNATANNLIDMLPVEFNMTELNGNEKYVTLDQSLVSNPKSIKHIDAGDICLYDDNNLVVFYKSFDTIYEYTKIGHIDNLPDLGNENITVKFEKR